MNPIQMIKNLITGGRSPQEIAMQMMGGNNNNNPVFNNLIEMAQKGDKKGVEQFARNLYSQQGKDFDKEFGEFMKNFK